MHQDLIFIPSTDALLKLDGRLFESVADVS